MNGPQPQHDPQAALLLGRIRGLHQLFEQSIANLRHSLDRFEASAPAEQLLRRADYWEAVIEYDSCVRLRQIIESNFHVIETLGLLATVRYVFELSTWLRLATTRPEYALAYYGELLKKEKEQSEEMVRQLKREMEFLETSEKRDNQSIVALRDTFSGDPDRPSAMDLQQLLKQSRADIDREAARTFSLYAQRGTTLGFGYAAHLVRTQALPKAEERATKASSAFDEFLAWCPADVKALVKPYWKWRSQAEKAGVEAQYDFIYSYVSRLLHATPASVTTDVKNLEAYEIALFLQYIQGALLDVLDLISKVRTKSTA